MKPLNPSEVVWLSGTGDEINRFLKCSAVWEHAVILGHPDDAKKTLIATARPGLEWELNFKPLLNGGDVEITFLLLQGKVVGLVRLCEVAPQPLCPTT